MGDFKPRIMTIHTTVSTDSQKAANRWSFFVSKELGGLKILTNHVSFGVVPNIDKVRAASACQSEVRARCSRCHSQYVSSKAGRLRASNLSRYGYSFGSQRYAKTKAYYAVQQYLLPRFDLDPLGSQPPGAPIQYGSWMWLVASLAFACRLLILFYFPVKHPSSLLRPVSFMQLLRGCWARRKHEYVLLRRLFDNLPN